MSKLTRNSFSYSVVLILQKSIGFFLLPVYTSFLSPKDYGTIAVVTSITTVLSLFYSLSLGSAVLRYYFEFKDQPEKLKKLWGACVTFVLCASALLTVVLTALHTFIIDPFLGEIGFFPFMFIGIISIALYPVYDLYQASLQAKQSGKRFAINNFAYFALNLCSTVFFVVFLRLEAVGVLISVLVTNTVFIIVAFAGFLPEIRLGLNREMLRLSLRYSLPLVPHSIAGWVMTSVDRLLINRIVDTASTGIYNLAYQFGNIIGSFSSAVNQAYTPWFFEQASAGEEGQQNIKANSLIYVQLMSIAALAMSVLSPEIIKVMVHKRFESSASLVPFISFTYAFSAIYSAISVSLSIKSTRLIPIITVSSGIFSVALNLILITRYGIMGAAVTSVASMFVASIATTVVALKVERIQFAWAKMFITVVLIFGIALASLRVAPLYLRLAVLLTALAAFVLTNRKKLGNLFLALR